MDGAPGRVWVACFSSHLHRIQQVADAARAFGRRLVPLGRSMEENVRLGVELGYLRLPPGQLATLEEARDLRPRETCVRRHRHAGRAPQRAGPRWRAASSPSLAGPPRRPGAPLLPLHPRERGGHRPHRERARRPAAPRCSGRTSARCTSPGTPRRRSSGGSCGWPAPSTSSPSTASSATWRGTPPTPPPRGSAPTGATCSWTARCSSSPTPGVRPRSRTASPPGASTWPATPASPWSPAGVVRDRRALAELGIVLVAVVVDRATRRAGSAPGDPGARRRGARRAGGGGGRRGGAGAPRRCPSAERDEAALEREGSLAVRRWFRREGGRRPAVQVVVLEI